MLMFPEGKPRVWGRRWGTFQGCAEPFYGTMAGPWWYHTATSVPRVRNLPFSLLRVLIQVRRQPPQGEGRGQKAEMGPRTTDHKGNAEMLTR